MSVHSESLTATPKVAELEDGTAVRPSSAQEKDKPALAQDDDLCFSAKAAFALLPDDVRHALRKSEGFDPDLTWTRREERWVTFKTDLCALVPVCLVFIFLALDRSNIANALTDNFLKDLHITQNELNNAVLIGNAAIGVFDIPSNVLAKRFGPNRYLPILVLAWGVVTIGQGFISTRAQLYACRFLVGAFEAGAIPGYAYYLVRFYRDREIASRYTLFWAANTFASAIGGLLSLGILSLRGTNGRAGWSYLFIIYGTLTCAVGLFAWVWLPDSPSSASRSWAFKRVWYTRRQASIVTTRVLLDEPAKAEEVRTAPVRSAEIIATLTDWRLWTLVLCAAATAVLYSPITTYSLLLIKSLGFKGYTANGLAVPGFVLSIAWSLTMGVLINRHGRHALYVFLTNVGAVVGLLWISLVPRNKAAQYVGILWLLTFNVSAVGVLGAWTAHVVPARQRAVALALTVSFNNLASLGGAQVLRASDAPRYQHGLWALTGTCTAGALMAIVAHFALRHRQRAR